MNWMQFISSMTTALAWPISTIVIVSIFRKGILARLPDIEDVDLLGVKAKFKRDLSKVAASVTAEEAGKLITQNESTPSAQSLTPVPALPATSSDTTPSSSNLSSPVDDTVATSTHSFLTKPPTFAGGGKVEEYLVDRIALQANPTGVVMEAWKELESEMRQFAGAESPLPIRHVIETLVEKSLITDDEAEQVQLMYNMRNRAAHASEPISKDDAEQFKNIATLLALRFHLRRSLAFK